MEPITITDIPNYFSSFDDDNYILFGAELSYFTRKLHAALLWSTGISFIWYNRSLSIKDNLELRSGSHQMPILLTPENWMIGLLFVFYLFILFLFILYS